MPPGWPVQLSLERSVDSDNGGERPFRSPREMLDLASRGALSQGKHFLSNLGWVAHRVTQAELVGLQRRRLPHHLRRSRGRTLDQRPPPTRRGGRRSLVFVFVLPADSDVAGRDSAVVAHQRRAPGSDFVQRRDTSLDAGARVGIDVPHGHRECHASAATDRLARPWATARLSGTPAP